MNWYESCKVSSLVTNAYKQVPDLDPFEVYTVDLDPGMPSMGVCGLMPTLPDDVNVPEGHIADKAEIALYFENVVELNITGSPDRTPGRLDIVKLRDSTAFEYRSDSFRFTGKCRCSTVAAFGILPKHDPSYAEPRGRLFSHPNVWNTCLLLIEEYGYDIRVTGHWTKREYPARLRWHATNSSGVDLSANSPIELLGLATLGRHHDGKHFEPYWWRIEGRSICSEIIENWQASSEPPQ